MGNRTSNFAGFDDWIEVFAGGPQTDAAGQTRQWSESDLDSIVGNFNADDPAPAVVGHPRSDAPAYGWVEGLKREGINLLAKFGQVAPEFDQMVRDGHFRKRSVAIDRAGDGFRLRHVGWLGAAAPAIPGLKPVQFTEASADFEFSFEEELTAGLFRTLREWFIAKFGLEAADTALPARDIKLLAELAAQPEPVPDTLNGSAFCGPDTGTHHISTPNLSGDSSNHDGDNTMSDGNKTFTQADIDAARLAGRTEVTGETAAVQSQLDAERRNVLTAKFQAQIDKAIEAGRLMPAQAEGLLEFMLSLPGDAEISFEYSTGKGDQAATTKATPSHWFDGFIAGLPVQVEVGGNSGAGGDIGPHASEFAAPTGYTVDTGKTELHNRALEYQKQHPDTPYLTAVKAVEGA